MLRHDQRNIKPSSKVKATPRDFPMPTLIKKLRPEDSLQEQRTSTLKKVKKDGRPEHDQGEGKKGKVQTQRKWFGTPGESSDLIMRIGGAAQNWFDDLDPKSADSFEELSQKFLEEFSQQKRYAKEPTEIYGLKRRQNKGLQAFIDQFKSESSHIKGVPPALRISAFMHNHGHPELAKNLNDKIPKTVDEMFERVRAFIRGEVVAGQQKWDRGHNTNDCHKLKKQIEEVVASGKLAHLVKDICRNNQKNESQGRNNVKVKTMIREGGNRKRPFEEERSGLTDELTFPAIP
ncbi:reverse transcriptase domain-containing protein [Tanacetum coccineum]